MATSVKDPMHLSKRERQIMELIYGRSEATAEEIAAALPDPPSTTAVRTMLTILERKGHIVHRKQSRQFVYRSTRPRQQVARSALRRLITTFFDGSLDRAVAAFMADPKSKLSPEQIDRLRELIDEASKQKEK
jgi:predicted transcriptional regulator